MSDFQIRVLSIWIIVATSPLVLLAGASMWVYKLVRGREMTPVSRDVIPWSYEDGSYQRGKVVGSKTVSLTLKKI